MSASGLICPRCHDLQKRVEELSEQRNRLYWRNNFEAGGLFRRRTTEEMLQSELIESIHIDHREDVYIIELTELARATFDSAGTHIRVDAYLNATRQGNIRAENWWHLCAKTGLTEVEARIFYHNPEIGQESAVKHGAVIACQGDYILIKTTHELGAEWVDLKRREREAIRAVRAAIEKDLDIGSEDYCFDFMKCSLRPGGRCKDSPVGVCVTVYDGSICPPCAYCDRERMCGSDD